jgi:ankyrin repeat protein
MEARMTSNPEPDQDTINEFVGNAHGNFARVQELLAEYPTILNARASWDETAIGAAAQMNRPDIAEFLLSHGAPLDIFTATVLGMTDKVKDFLKDDPSLINATGPHGIPVLYYPGLSNQKEIADLLLAHGAAVNTGEGGYPPIHAAAAFGHGEMVEWYLANGANVNAQDYDGKTPLYRANENEHTEVAELLRQRGGTE